MKLCDYAAIYNELYTAALLEIRGEDRNIISKCQRWLYDYMIGSGKTITELSNGNSYVELVLNEQLIAIELFYDAIYTNADSSYSSCTSSNISAPPNDVISISVNAGLSNSSEISNSNNNDGLKLISYLSIALAKAYNADVDTDNPVSCYVDGDSSGFDWGNLPVELFYDDKFIIYFPNYYTNSTWGMYRGGSPLTPSPSTILNNMDLDVVEDLPYEGVNGLFNYLTVDYFFISVVEFRTIVREFVRNTIPFPPGVIVSGDPEIGSANYSDELADPNTFSYKLPKFTIAYEWLNLISGELIYDIIDFDSIQLRYGSALDLFCKIQSGAYSGMIPIPNSVGKWQLKFILLGFVFHSSFSQGIKVTSTNPFLMDKYLYRPGVYKPEPRWLTTWSHIYSPGFSDGLTSSVLGVMDVIAPGRDLVVFIKKDLQIGTLNFMTATYRNKSRFNIYIKSDIYSYKLAPDSELVFTTHRPYMNVDSNSTIGSVITELSYNGCTALPLPSTDLVKRTPSGPPYIYEFAHNFANVKVYREPDYVNSTITLPNVGSLSFSVNYYVSDHLYIWLDEFGYPQSDTFLYSDLFSFLGFDSNTVITVPLNAESLIQSGSVIYINSCNIYNTIYDWKSIIDSYVDYIKPGAIATGSYFCFILPQLYLAVEGSILPSEIEVKLF
jgi:hypothetical protein